MLKPYYQRTTCRLCDSTRVVSGVKFEATPPGDIFIPREALDKPQERYPLEVMLCGSPPTM